MDKVFTNLPKQESTATIFNDSRVYFNSFGQPGQEFSGADVDATIGFLEQRGFSRDASIMTATVLLQQAKQDNYPVFDLLDTLKGFDSLELSSLVGEILNQNRSQISRLGFRTAPAINEVRDRNIRV